MTKLVNDLLTLSKFDNNNTKWEKTEFDLGELVKQCQENLQIEMDKKKQKVECFVTANVPSVYADKDGIERVVLNVLSNSVKYTGYVHVKHSITSNLFTVSVTDGTYTINKDKNYSDLAFVDVVDGTNELNITSNNICKET